MCMKVSNLVCLFNYFEQEPAVFNKVLYGFPQFFQKDARTVH
jgi:hypothetical protein